VDPAGEARRRGPARLEGALPGRGIRVSRRGLRAGTPVFASESFRRYRGRFWNPVYYPRPEAVRRIAVEAGFAAPIVESWTEPFAEKTPAAVASLIRATMERALGEIMPSAAVKQFFAAFEKALEASGDCASGRLLWRRMLVKARAL
jgi:hypothetical protein